MKENKTLLWLHKGARRAFIEKFVSIENVTVYFGAGIIIAMTLLPEGDLTFAQRLGIVSAALLALAPFCYFCLGIRHRVARSLKYQKLFLRNTVDKCDKYRKRLPALKKEISADYLDREGNTTDAAIRKRIQQAEDRLDMLELQKEEALSFLVEDYEQVKSTA